LSWDSSRWGAWTFLRSIDDIPESFCFDFLRALVHLVQEVGLEEKDLIVKVAVKKRLPRAYNLFEGMGKEVTDLEEDTALLDKLCTYVIHLSAVLTTWDITFPRATRYGIKLHNDHSQQVLDPATNEWVRFDGNVKKKMAEMEYFTLAETVKGEERPEDDEDNGMMI
jgi:hypothetical protein